MRWKRTCSRSVGKKARIDNVKDGSRSLILEKNIEGNTPKKTALVSLGISLKRITKLTKELIWMMRLILKRN